ncbi:hypothetical protein TNCV_3157901 [Trichonephila clavipes]|nr:hypothetical protein TNCV_3157901 [Trichonephila clavipes]
MTFTGLQERGKYDHFRRGHGLRSMKCFLNSEMEDMQNMYDGAEGNGRAAIRCTLNTSQENINQVMLCLNNGVEYWNVILEQNIRLFRATMGAKFDNVCPHRANIVNARAHECFISLYIYAIIFYLMLCPSFSQNLNRKEHVWDKID